MADRLELSDEYSFDSQRGIVDRRTGRVIPDDELDDVLGRASTRELEGALESLDDAVLMRRARNADSIRQLRRRLERAIRNRA